MTNALTLNEQKIYNILSDDKSKQVFMIRKKWAETGSADFVKVFDGRPIKPITELFNKLKGKSFVCYGAGEGCRNFLILASDFGMLQNCRTVFDSNSALHGTKIRGQLIRKYDDTMMAEIDYIIATPETYTISDDINNYLLALGMEPSKIILFADYFALNNIDVYFDNVVTEHFGEAEIFVDGGCLGFESSIAFLQHCPHTKKIYAFEPNTNQFEVIEKAIRHIGFKNTKIINGALWSKNTELCFEVREFKSASRVSCDASATNKVVAYALDSVVDIGDKITFIKMDIEGSELEALQGAQQVIKRDKPTLAISIYHKAQDYIDIPLYIKELVPEYKLYLRHYSSIYSETVLYCVI